MKKSKKGTVEISTYTILLIALALVVTVVMLIFIFKSADSSESLLGKLLRLFRG